MFAKKITIIACLLFVLTSGWAQSGMTDKQIIDYATKENAKGTSRQQIVIQLMQRGVTMDRLHRIQKQYKKQFSDNNIGAKDTDSGFKDAQKRTRVANGDKRDEEVINRTEPFSRNAMMADSISFFDFEAQDDLYNKNEEKRRIFGHDVFNNKNLTFESSMNLATPQNYRLGPGDAVNIDIWGASQESITEVISPDGTINVEDYGVISLSGLSVSQAKSKLQKVLGPRFQGSKIELTLGQTRTITVSIMGEVKVPGTYTMSAFATVYNALYMAGGPNEIGTLRNVKVYRRGKLVTTVDVYDFLLNGKLSGDIRLQDNDIITVSPYEALVNITGKVKRPMFYEMKKTESAATLLKYAGGFTGDAYTKTIRINRKSGNMYSVFSVGEFDLNDFKLMDEDCVNVESTLNRYQNMVEIQGAIFRPGMYQIGSNINTVKELVIAADGLKEGAIGQHAVMHRMKVDRSLEVLSIDIIGILEGTTPDIPLKNEDVIIIASKETLNQQQTVTISGEVLHPGVYRYASNTTVEDLILQAGGLTNAASMMKVDVARRINTPYAVEADNKIVENFTFKLTDDFNIAEQPDFTLQPFDEVFVRRSPNYTEQQKVNIQGEVQFEGTYALSEKGQRLSEIINQAGGLTNRAYPEGAKLLRQMTNEEREMVESMLRTTQRYSGQDSIATNKLLVEATYPVGIELEKALKRPGSEDDPVLREGDRIVVPYYDGTVKVNGEVLYPNTVFFKEGKGLDYYINLAGGTTSTAKKSRTIIVYMNGMVARADSKHQPRPGCQIIVPSKRKHNMLGVREWLSISTSAASLGTMAATIANLLK